MHRRMERESERERRSLPPQGAVEGVIEKTERGRARRLKGEISDLSIDLYLPPWK